MSTLHAAVEIFFISVGILTIWTIIVTLRGALRGE